MLSNYNNNFLGLIADKNAEGMAAWSFTLLAPQLVTIFLTTLLIMILSISYSKKIKKSEQLYEPRGLVLLVEMLVKMVENMVVEILGRRYKGFTVYCLYLLLYIIIGNLFSIVGFESPVSSYTVVLSMGMVAFIGIYYFGIKYQKLSFFKKYLVNPLELLSQFVPLISMTFRLFGNVLGGPIILELLYYFTGYIWSHVPIFGPIDMLALVILPWVHIYLDIFDDTIQAYIFTILGLIYWQSEMNHSSEKKNKKGLDIQRNPKIQEESEVLLKKNKKQNKKELKQYNSL